jgi:hypothetical protein
MKTLRYALVLALAVTASSGCRSVVLQKDQDQFRDKMLDFYTNQIMDNLIRAANGLPIVQVEYTTISGTVTDTAGGSLGGSQTTTNDRSRSFAEMAMKTFTHTFVNVFNYEARANRDTQLAIQASPITDKPEVYRAYLEFLSLPGSLIRDCNPPPHGAAHLVRQYGDVYFYVPINYRKEFFDLSLRTTVLRGEPAPPPVSYKRTVTKAEVVRSAGTQHRLKLSIDQQIPNDLGTLKAKINDFVFLFQVIRNPNPEDVPPDEDTGEIFIIYNQSPQGVPLPPGDVVGGLTDKEVEITLESHRPSPSSTDELLESIFNQTQLFRLNQMRLGR